MKLVMEEGWWWRWWQIPLPEPRTDSGSALPREFRAWRRLRIVKRDESFSLIFFSPKVNIWSWSWGRWSTRGPRGREARPGGRARPPPSWTGCGPPDVDLSTSIFYIFQNNSPLIIRSFRELLFLHKNNTMAILLKIVSVWVSSIQIMQVRVQNKGKSVWKSRYVADVCTPPSLNLCLSSSSSVDKMKVIKKNFYKLCLLLLL